MTALLRTARILGRILETWGDLLSLKLQWKQSANTDVKNSKGVNNNMEQPNQDKIKTLAENETYKYLGTLEADTIKQVEMKDKIQKEYLRRTRKLLETKLNRRNLIKGINTCAVPLVRYPGPFLKWTRDELKQMDQRTRKLMTMHKALHPSEEEDLPALKTALTLRYNDSKTIYKNTKEDSLQPQETILTTRWTTEWQ